VTVLLVEDDPISALISSQAVSDIYDVVHVSNGLTALDFCESTPPDLVLMDINMPAMNGLVACNLLKANEVTQDIPVIFITANSDPTSEDECWDAGCVDFISKPFSVKTLRHRVNAHLSVKLLTDKLKRLATYDGLTNIQNRRFFDSYIDEQVKLSVRQKTPLGLLMIDIDYFKQYNDNYGHLKGDDCLKDVAAALVAVAERPTDCVARFGGEEFAIVMPNTDDKGVQHVGEHLLKTIQELNIEHTGSPIQKLTVSLGGASLSGASLDVNALIELADKRLYQAKQTGRNKLLSVG
jgi:diguanylate cyclase (GGDEF)-like protein